MSDQLPEYWQSLAERAGTLEPAEREREFPEELPVGPGQEKAGFVRRDFFKVMGLSAAAATAACSRAPVQKIIPFTQKPEEMVPGTALWYASTCAGCGAGCGLLLKTRDGRPIKVEGNDAHPVSAGGVCAIGQASVLSLYDAARARTPSSGGKPAEWAALDAAVVSGLEQANGAGQGIRLLLPWVIGPSAEAAVAQLLAKYPSARVVRHDPLGVLPAVGEAHRLTHGVRALPQYRFDEAKVIVSFGADFLGTWLTPVVSTRQYARGRDVAHGKMSRHLQLESTMSLTGSNADQRFVLAPSDQGRALAGLVTRLSARSGRVDPSVVAKATAGFGDPELPAQVLDEVAEALRGAGAGGLVVSGSEDPRVQALANLANELLGAYGSTLSVERGVSLDQTAQPFGEFLAELREGKIGAVIVAGVNPVYDHPRGAELSGLLAKVALTVSTADRLDETASALGHHAPEHNFLEDWGDAEPARGVLGLRQPAVAPLFETRSAWESILRWAGVQQGWYDFLRARWEREVFPSALEAGLSFQAFWDRSVQLGLSSVPAAAEPVAFRPEALLALGDAKAPQGGELELVLYPKVSLGAGALANNGWLQELPDPVTKVAWGNYAQISPALAKARGISEGQLLKVSVGDRSVTLPAQVQPGLHGKAVAVAVGYGRTHAGKVGNGVGQNAFPLAGEVDGRAALVVSGASLAVAGGSKPLALAQTHHSAEGRPLVREASLKELSDTHHAKAEGHGTTRRSLWSGHAYAGHRWGMAVDLTACTGCSACVVACQAENNIPVVGEDEVRRRRDMAWLRLDRYYAGPPENPRVVHQPMMCQHCENAPCETVCPVLATVHSKEGLNQQVYNRCVGTRYCANNCPPKVRRFNWFDYPHDEPLERMVLNPDVVVRSRGVMEKCSMCVQRIHEGTARARRDGRPLADGDIRTACQQSCPAQAIHFGDLNDPSSAAAKLAASGRAYQLFEELNVGPVINYLTKVRNPGSSA